MHGASTESFTGPACDGEDALITITWRGVLHTTAFDDGRYHITGTLHGWFTWEQGGETYSGHFTQSFGENVNGRNHNNTFTLNGEGWGTDGRKVQVKDVAHVATNANGETVVEFEAFSVTCR
jgi:hypothetical protein